MKKIICLLLLLISIGVSAQKGPGKIGIVSYTYRNSFPKNFEATLDTIKALGINNIEFSSLFGQTPEKIREMLNARGMYCTSYGVSYDDAVNRTHEVGRIAQVLGAEYVRVAWLALKEPLTASEAEKIAQNFNTIGAILSSGYDLTFCYHNHGYEFGAYEGGTLFDLIVKKDGNVERIQHIKLQDETVEQFNLLTDIQPDSTVSPAPETKLLPLEVKPEAKTELAVIKPDTIYIPRLLFGFNQSELTAEESGLFMQWLARLAIKEVKTIRLIGYTDDIGTRKYNIRLSLNRAKTIKALMVQKGIPESSISVEGKGNTDFIAPNKTAEGMDNPEGRALNRRVEIEIQFLDPKRFIINNLINTNAVAR
jgi:outer membrane protein OmpA-like peptidoglycan-associated protein